MKVNRFLIGTKLVLNHAEVNSSRIRRRFRTSAIAVWKTEHARRKRRPVIICRHVNSNIVAAFGLIIQLKFWQNRFVKLREDVANSINSVACLIKTKTEKKKNTTVPDGRRRLRVILLKVTFALEKTYFIIWGTESLRLNEKYFHDKLKVRTTIIFSFHRGNFAITGNDDFGCNQDYSALVVNPSIG